MKLEKLDNHAEKEYYNNAQFNEHHLIKRILKEIPENSYLLDAGTRSGAWLYVLCKKTKSTGVGLDICKASDPIIDDSIEYKFGYDLSMDRLAKEEPPIPFKNETFDVVTCLHTLEHIWIPGADTAVKQLIRVCKTGGKIIIAVPMYGEWGRGCDEHINNYDDERILRLAKRTGLQYKIEKVMPGMSSWLVILYK